MSDEEDAKKIIDFALVPVGAIIEIAQTGHWSRLIGICLDSDARVVADTEHVVHDLESLVLGGVIDSSNVRDLSVFGSGVVLEEGEGGDDTGGRDIDGQFIFPDGESASLSNIILPYKTS